METVELTFLDEARGNTRVPGLRVYVYDDLGVYVVQGLTDSEGEVSFSLEPGTYELRTHKVGITGTSEALVVTLGGGEFTFYVSTITVGPPPNARVCRLFGDFVSLEGLPYTQFKLQVQLLFDPVNVQGLGLVDKLREYETDDSGHVEFDVVRGAHIRVSFITTPLSRDFYVPDQPTANLLTLLGSSTDNFKVVKR